MLSPFSRSQLLATPWTVAFQAPLSMRFSRQEYWSGLPCPPPGDLPGPGIESVFLTSPALAAAAKSLQSCLTLCDPIDGSPPGSPVPGILQSRILEWVAIAFPCWYVFKLFPTFHYYNKSEVAQSCPTLCDPMDCSLRGSSVHGIFQARVLEWGAIAFSHNKHQ